MRRKEFDILVLLAEHPGWVYTKEQIYRSIWCEEVPVDVDNAVTCQMKQLRKKLGENPKGTPYIETVWGVGYKFSHGMKSEKKLYKKQYCIVLGSAFSLMLIDCILE